MSQRSCMKETLLLGLSFLLGLCSYDLKQGAMAQEPGFVSIDCGSTSNGNYTESQILWTLDGNLTQGEGEVYAVQGPDGDVSKRYTTIRYFSGNQTKYCYSLSGVTKGSFYLVRASFWTGKVTTTVYTRNYVAFTLLVNADEWAPVNISLPQSTPFVEEAYVQAISISNVMSVCLSSRLAASSQAGDPPFISSLELRPLTLTMHPVVTMIQTQRALRLTAREAYGSYSTGVIRYPDDSFDRIWTTFNSSSSLSTSENLNNTFDDLPPKLVLQNIYVSNWTTGFFINYTNIQSSSSYFYALYFSEIDPNVTSAGLRVFNVTLNGDYEFTVNGPDPNYDIGLYGVLEVHTTEPYTAMVDYLLFHFTPTSNSTYLPIISGIEVLQYFDNPWSNGTFDDDGFSVSSCLQRISWQL